MSFTPQQLATAIGGRCARGVDSACAETAPIAGRVVHDSRQVQPGDVFWALRGTRQRGTDFIDDALARGAVGAVTDVVGIQPPPGRWVITVQDAYESFVQAARWQRDRFTGRVVAVTGSVGKTTARQMIDAVLSHRLTGTATARNYNNHVGVPLSMLAWKPNDNYAVVELGASATGEIAMLAEWCRPHVAVITRLGDAHLGTFGSRDAIDTAKAELLDALPDDGLAVLNADDARVRRIAARSPARIAWVGESVFADVRASHVFAGPGSLQFTVDGHRFDVPVWGRHHLGSALSAVAIGRHFGLNLREIAYGLAEFRAPEMRCEVRAWRGATVINDCYNSSPLAVRAALELLQNIETSGRRVILLGDMCDLGNEAVVLHRRAAEDAVTIGRADMLIACGRYASQMVEAARRIGLPPTDAIASDVRSAIEIIRQHLTPGDVLLIKGSRVMALERVMRTLEETSSRVGQTFLSAEARTTDGRQECLPHQDAQLVDARYSVA